MTAGRAPQWTIPLALGGAAAGAGATYAAYLTSPLLPLAALAAAGFVAITLRSPSWGMALSFAALPLESLSVGSASPTETGLVVVAGGWLARAAFKPGSVVLPSPRDAPLALLLIAIAAGLLRAEDPAPVLRILVLWTLFSLTYLQAQSLTAEEVRRVVAGLVVGAGILGAIGTLGFLQSGDTALAQGGLETGARAVGTFADANYFAAVLLLAILPGLGLLLADPRRNGWLAPLVALGIAGLAFSLSRGGITGFVAGAVLLLAWGRARWLGVGLAIVLALSTLTGLNPLLSSGKVAVVGERLSTVTSADSVGNSRPRAWSIARDIAVENPVFGVGVNQYRFEAGRRGLFERGSPLENAHSIPFSLAAETGFAGLLAFVAWMVQLAGRAAVALRSRDRLAYALALGLAAGMTGFLVQGFTVVQLRTEVVASAFFVSAGLLSGLARRAR